MFGAVVFRKGYFAVLKDTQYVIRQEENTAEIVINVNQQRDAKAM